MLNINDANKETNAAYEEPKKKVYVKLIIFLALVAALFIVLGAKFVLFYYRTHGIGGHYFYKGCDAEVVHVLPEGLTDEAISDAVINVEYGKEKNDFDKYDCLAESHYLLGVQNVDDTHCKVYVMSLCERYRYSYTENVSGSSMCRMIDFQKREWRVGNDRQLAAEGRCRLYGINKANCSQGDLRRGGRYTDTYKRANGRKY